MVVLVKLFEHVQYMKVDPLAKLTTTQRENFASLAHTCLYSIMMYFVENVQPQLTHHAHGRYLNNATRDTKLLSTQSLEVIYSTLLTLQSSSQLFTRGSFGVAGRSPVAQQLIKDESHNLLLSVRDILFKFFDSAFKIAAHRDSAFGLRQNRLSDVAIVWL